MGHVRLTNAKREAILQKAKTAFSSSGISHDLTNNTLPRNVEEALVLKAKSDPYMLELVDFVVKRRSFFEDFVDFNYYDEKDPMSTLFRRGDSDTDHIKDINYIRFSHPWSSHINIFSHRDPENRADKLTISTSNENTYFTHSNWVWVEATRNEREGDQSPSDITQFYQDAGVTIDELLKIEPRPAFMQGLEIVNADANTVYNTFDHSENNPSFDVNLDMVGGNDLFFRKFDPKDKYRSESYDITLKNPVFYPKVPGKQYPQIRITTEDPFVSNMLKSFLIARAMVQKDKGKYMKTIEAVLELSNTVKQLINLMPSMETFVEQEDLAKTNQKQTKKGSTLEERQKQLEELGLDTDKVNQVALTASLEN
mgnify:CR=1 FL=1